MSLEGAIVTNNFLKAYKLLAQRVEAPRQRTPLEDRCRVVADWEPHRSCWVGVPSNKNLWPDDAKRAIETCCELASAISQFEPVVMCANAMQWETIRELLPDHIRVFELSTNDAWIRHTGPTFLVGKSGDVRGVHWGFSGSGGKHHSRTLRWKEDGLFSCKLLEVEQIYRYECIKIITEAASFDTDGEGTMLASEICMLHAGRDTGLNLDKAGLEHLLTTYLGIQKIIWLPSGLVGDRYTNGHLPALVRFSAPAVVLLSWREEGEEISAANDQQSAAVTKLATEQSEACYKALGVLTRERDAADRVLEIHKIPLPSRPVVIAPKDVPVEAIEGHHIVQTGDIIPISYNNFLLTNGGVVLPAYGDINDRVALKLISKRFPHRRVVQFYARDLAVSGLSVRCVTLPVPTGTKEHRLSSTGFPPGNAVSKHRAHVDQEEKKGKAAKTKRGPGEAVRKPGAALDAAMAAATESGALTQIQLESVASNSNEHLVRVNNQKDASESKATGMSQLEMARQHYLLTATGEQNGNRDGRRRSSESRDMLNGAKGRVIYEDEEGEDEDEVPMLPPDMLPNDWESGSEGSVPPPPDELFSGDIDDADDDNDHDVSDDEAPPTAVENDDLVEDTDGNDMQGNLAFKLK